MNRPILIIAIGYRIQSVVATRFRRWATERLHEYIQKGFSLDDERLKYKFDILVQRHHLDRDKILKEAGIASSPSKASKKKKVAKSNKSNISE